MQELSIEVARERRPWGRVVVGIVLAISAYVGGRAVFDLVFSGGQPIGVAEYAKGTQRIDHTSVAGRFVAQFPKAPSSVKQDVQTQVGTLHMKVDMAEGQDGEVGVAYVDYPSAFARITRARLDGLLRANVTGTAKGLGGILASSKLTSMLGHRAIDYHIDTSDGSFFARAFLVGRRLYVLHVATLTNGHQALARLVRSFRLR